MVPLHLIIASLALGARCAHAATAAVSDSQFSSITDEEWASMFATPNATAQVPFPGYDITTPYPGNRSSDWRLSIQVKEGIPSNFEGLVATGIWITWGAPRDLMVKNTTNDTYGLAPLHPSWNITQTFVHAAKLRSDADDVDPTCKGVLPGACIADFRARLADTYNGGGNQTGTDRFSNVSPPSSCQREDNLRSYEAYTMPFPVEKLNRTKKEDGLFNYATLSPGITSRHKPGNLTDYDRSIRSVYVMMFVWGYSNLTGLTPEMTKPETAIVCVRANVVEGSRTLEDGQDNPDLKEGGSGAGNGAGNGNGNGGGPNNDNKPSGAVRIGSMGEFWLLTVAAGVVLML